MMLLLYTYINCWFVVIWITLDFTLNCFTLTVLGLVGKVDFTVRHLSSATTGFPNTFSFSSSEPCIGNGVHQVGEQFCYFNSFVILSWPSCLVKVVTSQTLVVLIDIFSIYSQFVHAIICSALHILQVLRLKRPGQCALHSLNMLLLWLQLLDQCFSWYVNVYCI